MKCTNCSNTVPNSAKVCGYCGHPLKSGGPTPSDTQPREKPAGKPKRGLVAGLIIAGIVITGLAVGILYLLNREEPLLLTQTQEHVILDEPPAESSPEPIAEVAKDDPLGAPQNECTDWAAMVSETIPDGTPMDAGASFTKTWKFRNTGTCTWTTQYSLSLNSGDALGNKGYPNLQHAVAPGEVIEVAVQMTAPQTPGTYEGHWVLNNAAGKSFGVGKNADQAVWVNIVVGSALPERCSLFDQDKMELTYLDWEKGGALTLYLTIPGGVPGLEKQILGDDEPWEYIGMIADIRSQPCSFEGYKEFLYCTFLLPATYSFTAQNLDIYVNYCEKSIFSQHPAYLPKMQGTDDQAGSTTGPTCTMATSWTCGGWTAYCACLGLTVHGLPGSCYCAP
jgi:hypothetical protein